MKGRNIALIILGSALLIVVLAFVGRWAMHLGAVTPSSDHSASSAPSQTASVAIPSVPDTGGSPGSTTITQADSGKTVTLKAGTRFLLDLGGTEDWAVKIGDASIVRRVPGVLTVKGSQGLFEVLRVGTTTLSAEGRPNCSVGEMCAQYIIDFKATINGV